MVGRGLAAKVAGPTVHAGSVAVSGLTIAGIAKLAYGEAAQAEIGVKSAVSAAARGPPHVSSLEAASRPSSDGLSVADSRVAKLIAEIEKASREVVFRAAARTITEITICRPAAATGAISESTGPEVRES